LWGFSAAVFINYVVALLQEHTENRLMGRVMSMYSLVFFLSMPFGYAWAGMLTTQFGTHVTLLASAISAMVCGLAAMAFMPAVRAMR
jgi:MFS family permease